MKNIFSISSVCLLCFLFLGGHEKREVKKEVDSYNFSRVGRTFGVFALSHDNNYSKQDFESFLINNVPETIRKNFSPILKMTLRLAEWHQVDPLWVLAIMWAESHYQKSIKSPMGAMGLMQIMPNTQKALQTHRQCQNQNQHFDFLVNEKKEDMVLLSMFDPRLNVETGILYLKCLLKIFNNDLQLATVAYNMGPGRIRQHLNQRLAVGENNRYLNRVREAYAKLSDNFQYE